MEAPKEQSTESPCVMDIDVGLRRRLSLRWPRQRHGEMQICTCEAPLGRSSHSEGDTFVWCFSEKWTHGEGDGLPKENYTPPTGSESALTSASGRSTRLSHDRYARLLCHSWEHGDPCRAQALGLSSAVPL